MIQGEPGQKIDADRPARGRQGAGGHRHRPRRDQGAERPGRPPQGRRPQGVGLLHRQGEPHRLRPPDQLQQDHGGRAEGRRARSSRRTACAAWSSTCATTPAACSRSAVEISDLFLTDGRIVSTKGRNHKDEVYDAKPEGTLLDCRPSKCPMAVLVNKYSASASEIVSAAPAGPRPGRRHRRAQLRQGQRAEHHPDGARHQRPEADDGELLAAERQEHPPLPRQARTTDEWGVKPDDGFEVTLKDEERLRVHDLPQRPRRRPRQGKPKPTSRKTDKDEQGRRSPSSIAC